MGAETRGERFGADEFLLLSGETCGFSGTGKAGKRLRAAGAAEPGGFASVGWDDGAQGTDLCLIFFLVRCYLT